MHEFGLVLSGGGTKGAFEMGVWKALRELNLEPSCVIGTSVGAINAAVIAQNDFEKAYQFWSNLTINQVLKLSSHMADRYVSEWSLNNFEWFRSSFLNDLFHGGLDISPLRQNLEAIIDEEAIRRSPIRLGLVTVELNTLSPKQLMIEDIPEGQLMDYLFASAALPVFQKQEIDGKTYLDGGFYDNVPINFMVDQGYHHIISVEFPALGIKHKLSNQNIDLTVIKNSEYLGMTLEFDQATISNNLTMGYLDTLKTLGDLSGRYYYLDMKTSHRLYDRLDQFLGMPLSDPFLEEKCLCLLNLEKNVSREIVLKRIAELTAQLGYTDERPLLLSLLEISARSTNIPRLKKFTPDTLLSEILKALSALIQTNLSVIKAPGTIRDAFKELPKNASGSILDFITAYILFAGARRDMDRSRLMNLIKKCSKETLLTILLILYLHEVLEKN